MCGLGVVFLIRDDRELDIGVGCGVARLPKWRFHCVCLWLRGVVSILLIQGCFRGVMRHGLALKGRCLYPVHLACACFVELLKVYRLNGNAVFLVGDVCERASLGGSEYHTFGVIVVALDVAILVVLGGALKDLDRLHIHFCF